MRAALTIFLMVTMVFTISCKKEQSDKADVGEESQSTDAMSLNGAGATFPYPVYSQWAHKYHNLNGTKINYQSIGSGGGIRQITEKTVDFGASDAPMKSQELEEAGLLQFPMIIGGVVPVIHVEGIEAGQLHLDPKTLAAIYAGKIKKWNHKEIQNLNSDLTLPDKAITVVHRADGSGTTWIFTNYLAIVDEFWKENVGAGKSVAWPAGVGGKGNEGVASYVQRIDGGIGYVEYAYALQNKMTHILLKNHDGKFVAPTMESFMAAAEGADWENAPGFYVVLVNQPGANSWPITGASFILLHKQQSDMDKAKTMLNFFDWCYTHGSQIAKELDYVPIPASVVEIIEKAWANELSQNGNPVWTVKKAS